MAGVLAQTNAALKRVLAAPVLSDAFASDSFSAGSGEGPEEPLAKWEGSRGVWIAPISQRLEASTDGRDELEEPRLRCPVICEIEIGDLLEIERDGSTLTWKVSGVTRHGQGVELVAGQTYELTIEAS